jgi:RecB family exonuclease
MAVVVRSRSQLEVVRRSLALAEVPVRSSLGGAALRDDRAARALLTLVDVAIGRAPLTAENATELLLGPFGGLDRLGLRRLRLALKAEEFSGGGARTADELLVEGLAAPGRFVTIDHRVGRAAEKLAGTLASLRDSDGSIEELLWVAWERSGLARTWYDQALGAGVVADEANRNLDGMVALFTAAKRFAERQPDAPPENFLADVLDADIPEDTLSPQSGSDAVLVTTAAGTVGLEMDTVVVTGLQDGAWPNLRLRGSLLAPQELVRVVLGVDSSTIDERRQVLGDELRMFALAVSRARRRVILASIANDDEAPSVFLGLVPDGTEVLDSSTVRPLTLRGVTGRLRRQLASPATPAEVRAAAASTLAALASQGIAGADPADWHGLVEISSTGPLYDDLPVPVSPSRIEKLEDSPLDWFLDTIAGSDPGVIANVGTIVHWAMETVEDPSSEALWSAVDSRWAELVFEAPWLSERQRALARGFTEALAEYLGDFRSEGKRLVAAEGRFELELDRAIVRGSIDRVEQDAAGRVTIVDLKTGSPITSQPKIDTHPQLAAYQLAYAEGKFDELLDGAAHAPGGAKLLFVKQGVRGKRYREAVQQPLTEEQLDEFRERIRAAAKLIAAAEFDGVLELPAYGGFGTDVQLRMHRVRAVSSD